MEILNATISPLFGGLLMGIAFLCLMGFLYYRDPALKIFGQYTLAIIVLIFLLIFREAWHLYLSDVIIFTLDIASWAVLVSYQQQIAGTLLNLTYYSPRFHRYYRISRFSLFGLLAAYALLPILRPANRELISSGMVLLKTADIYIHINTVIAVVICARGGHKGIHFMVFGSIVWLILTFGVMIYRTANGMGAFSFSYLSHTGDRFVLLAETLVFSAAILYRMSSQFTANQRVVAELMFTDAALDDYREKMISLQENFSNAITKNLKIPLQQLIVRLKKIAKKNKTAVAVSEFAELIQLTESIDSNAEIIAEQKAEINEHPVRDKGAKNQTVRSAYTTRATIVTGTVVIYSENALSLLAYGNILRNAGMEVIEADNNRRLAITIDSISEIHLILIVCNNERDTKSGTGLCKQVRRKKARTELPIIVSLPILNEPEEITGFFESGASDVVTKFLSEEEIIARVRVNIEYSRMAAELKDLHNDLEERLKHDTEQLRLQGRMNPHFLFNSLNTILALVDSDKASARKAILLLSDIYRFYLEFSYASVIPMPVEWEFTKNYLELTKIRYGNFLKVSMPDEFDEAEGFGIPPLSLQPLVENAVKHGLRENERNGHISIHGSLVKDGVQIRIEDNGAGIQKIDNSRSLGNIRKRLLFYYHHADLQLKNRPSGGTECLLKFSGAKKS
jgi:CheY-like chemotaxis protein